MVPIVDTLMGNLRDHQFEIIVIIKNEISSNGNKSQRSSQKCDRTPYTIKGS